MKNVLSVSLLVSILMLSLFAIAEETTGTESSGAVMKKTEISKSFVRNIGAKAYSAPGIKKKIAQEQTAKAFAPGQMKKVAGATSARGFAKRPGEAEARKNKILEEAAKKVKPKKRLTRAEYEKSPLKGVHIPKKMKK